MATQPVPPQTVSVGGGFQPTAVSPPESGNQLQITPEQIAAAAQAESEAQVETETQAPSAPSRTSAIPSSEPGLTPMLNLANLQARGQETRTLQWPFGYRDCRTWVQRYIIPMMSGFVVCGPYDVALRVTVDFGQAELVNERLVVPVIEVTAGGVSGDADVELTPDDQVVLIESADGNRLWPTAAQLASEPYTIGLEGAYRYDTSMSFLARMDEALAEACTASGAIGEVFGFSQYQADFVGGCG
jgi:hypothetical protein